jgi:integrase
MGQLRFRGKFWYIRYYRAGKRYEENTKKTKRTEAEAILRKREGDIQNGVPVTPMHSRVRFDDAATDIETEYKANGRKSLDALTRRIAKHLRPYFGGRKLAHITGADVNAYKLHRQTEGAANGSINRELAALRRMFALARENGKTTSTPVIKMLDEHNTRTGFFELDQFEAVRRHLPRDIQPVITFGFWSGWRIPSEVLTLQWRHVDFAAAEVRLDPGTTKNGEGRTLPFGDLPELAELLTARKAATEAVERATGRIVPHVFHRNGKPVRSFRKAWAVACDLAGCPGRIPHDLRRTAVRNFVRLGVPQAVAMEITGHKTASVFERYNITDENDKRAALSKLAGAVKAAAESAGPARRPKLAGAKPGAIVRFSSERRAG